MKKLLLLILLLVCLVLGGCDTSETSGASIVSVDSNDNQPEEMDENWIESCSDRILPFTDSTFGILLSNFSNEAYNLVLSNSNDLNYDNLLGFQEEIDSLIDAFISYDLPVNSGLEDGWDRLGTKLRQMKQSVDACIEGVYDKDLNSVENNLDYCANVDFVVEANKLLNILEIQNQDATRQENNASIEIVVSAEEAADKAHRVARYITGNENVELILWDELYYTPDINGKYYEYLIVGDEETSILISVVDGAAVVKKSTSADTEFQFISDGSLPAEESDSVVPNIVGLSPDEAKSLLDSQGIAWEEAGYMDWDGIESGLVCRQYPSAGNALLDDTVVHITISKP